MEKLPTVYEDLYILGSLNLDVAKHASTPLSMDSPRVNTVIFGGTVAGVGAIIITKQRGCRRSFVCTDY